MIVFKKNDLRTTVDICDMTLVKWPMMSFGNVKDISKVLIWFVMYFFCYSPTDFFCIFLLVLLFTAFLPTDRKMRHFRILGRCHHKISISSQCPPLGFPPSTFWSLFMVPHHCTTVYCTLVFMDVREEKGWRSLYFPLGLVYPPSCPCYDTLGRVMCQTTLLLRTMKEIIKTKKC